MAAALGATLLAHWLLGLAGVVVVAMAAAIGGFALAWQMRSADLAAAEHAHDLDAADDEGEWPERELLASVVDFPDTIAREVMVPRPDMVTVDGEFRVADVIEVMLLNGYSRLPVCGEGIDDVLGLAYAKDLMGAARDGREGHHVTEAMRPAMFVPETARLPELLRQMQEEQFHMAVVLDEYGGTAGLVTLEDIIEELVGEIHDEFDVEVPLVEALPGGDLLVRGRTPLDELNEMLGAHLPTGDWDTVAGLVTSRLGHVPIEGEAVEVAGWRLTAQRIQGRRIGRVHMSRLASSEGSTALIRPPEPPSDNDTAPDAGERDDSSGSRADGEGLRQAAPEAGDDRPARDSGQVGGMEVLPLGILVFVVVVLLIVNVWGVVDARLAVDAAAREAARTYVEAGVVDDAGADVAAAEATEAGLAALEAHGRDAGRGEVWLDSVSGPGGEGRFDRCARVRFAASYEVPAISLPWLGGFGRGFEVTAHHSELVDRYRDGVPGDASTC